MSNPWKKENWMPSHKTKSKHPTLGAIFGALLVGLLAYGVILWLNPKDVVLEATASFWVVFAGSLIILIAVENDPKDDFAVGFIVTAGASLFIVSMTIGLGLAITYSPPSDDTPDGTPEFSSEYSVTYFADEPHHIDVLAVHWDDKMIVTFHEIGNYTFTTEGRVKTVEVDEFKEDNGWVVHYHKEWLYLDLPSDEFVELTIEYNGQEETQEV